MSAAWITRIRTYTKEQVADAAGYTLYIGSRQQCRAQASSHACHTSTLSGNSCRYLAGNDRAGQKRLFNCTSSKRLGKHAFIARLKNYPMRSGPIVLTCRPRKRQLKSRRRFLSLLAQVAHQQLVAAEHIQGEKTGTRQRMLSHAFRSYYP